MEMNVYIANLGKYNEGELVGAWFSLPVDPEDVAEKIGLSSEYQEYAIHDYELPFSVGEYESLDQLNHLCELAEELEGTPLYDALPELLSSGYFDGLEGLVARQDDIRCWPDCIDMADVAYEYVEEGYLGEVPESLARYLDYEKIGRDMEINGTFIKTKQGIFELW